MSLKLAGKIAPRTDAIDTIPSRGFDTFEIYLAKQHLDNIQETIRLLKDAKKKYKISFLSVHTPHNPDIDFYLEKTKELAKEVGVKMIVFHNLHIGNMFSEDILEKVTEGMIVENGSDDAIHDVRSIEGVINKGISICFDIAHFCFDCERSGRDFYRDLEELFKSCSTGIKLIHYNDCKGSQDNLAIGDGAINHKKALSIISKYYSGTLVLEVPPERQSESREIVEKILKGIK